MKVFMCSCLLLFGIVACYQGPQKPAAPIAEEKMVTVLADVHVAEALLTEVSPGPKKDSMAQLYYQQIYMINNVTPEEFDQSMQAYMKNPFELDSLYSKVIGKLGEYNERFIPKIKTKKK